MYIRNKKNIETNKVGKITKELFVKYAYFKGRDPSTFISG